MEVEVVTKIDRGRSVAKGGGGNVLERRYVETLSKDFLHLVRKLQVGGVGGGAGEEGAGVSGEGDEVLVGGGLGDPFFGFFDLVGGVRGAKALVVVGEAAAGKGADIRGGSNKHSVERMLREREDEICEEDSVYRMVLNSNSFAWLYTLEGGLQRFL